MKEFFGFGGYQRVPEGYFSWQHLTFVTLLMIIMTVCAIILGKRFKNVSPEKKNRVLIVSAILIDAFEIFKIIICCVRSDDPKAWQMMLPLFLCSIQLIAIPMAAFCHGRMKEATLDFVFIFGILGAIFGTYFAGQNYGCYPVLSFDNVISGVTHAIAGFTSLYIVISGMVSMKKKNIPITFAILFGFCFAAIIANKLVDYNYMFLVRGDGTPYDIIYNLVDGNAILYPSGVIGLFLLYIVAYYGVFYLISRRLKTAKE